MIISLSPIGIQSKCLKNRWAFGISIRPYSARLDAGCKPAKRRKNGPLNRAWVGSVGMLFADRPVRWGLEANGRTRPTAALRARARKQPVSAARRARSGRFRRPMTVVATRGNLPLPQPRTSRAAMTVKSGWLATLLVVFAVSAISTSSGAVRCTDAYTDA